MTLVNGTDELIDQKVVVTFCTLLILEDTWTPVGFEWAFRLEHERRWKHVDMCQHTVCYVGPRPNDISARGSIELFSHSGFTFFQSSIIMAFPRCNGPEFRLRDRCSRAYRVTLFGDNPL